MRVLLVSANREDFNMLPLPLGPSLVAAAAKSAGHRVELLDLMDAGDTREALGEAVARFRPEVIGVSVRNIDDQFMEAPRFLLDQAREVVSHLRSLSGAPVVLGGAGYSIFPEAALRYLGADMGIQGEGEAAFPLLLKHLELGEEISNVPGLYLKDLGIQRARSFESNLDRLLMADEFLLPLAEPSDQEVWAPVQTRRGCPMDCTYCSTPAIEGRTIRKRTVESVAKSIARLARAGFKRFFFTDNTFNLPPSYAKSLCRALAKSGLDIGFRCILYPGKIDEELASLMAEAGCLEVALGFESGSQRMLRSYNKRFGPEEVRRDCRTLRRQGIGTMGFLLLGGPGETRESVLESLRFADSLDIDALKITVGIRVYPYTRLAEIAATERVVSRDDDLLMPRFYLAESLGDWLGETLGEWMGERGNWMF